MEDNDFFMELALLTAKRSEDPETQVGACFVKDGQVISTGYNCMPEGSRDQSWTKDDKKPYVCHAEYNAFINRGDKSIKESTLYIGLFPCKDCAKLITQAGVSKVIFRNDRKKRTYKIAKKIFEKTKVEYSQYTNKKRR